MIKLFSNNFTAIKNLQLTEFIVLLIYIFYGNEKYLSERDTITE